MAGSCGQDSHVTIAGEPVAGNGTAGSGPGRWEKNSSGHLPRGPPARRWSTMIGATAYAIRVPDDLPWEHYECGRLRPDRSYQAGRDFVESCCLRDANAKIGNPWSFAPPIVVAATDSPPVWIGRFRAGEV